MTQRVRMLIFVLNKVDLQLILEEKKSAGNYYQVCPKNP